MKRQKNVSWISGIVMLLFASGLLFSPRPVQAVLNVPAGATITSATLSLYVEASDYAAVRAHRILTNWDEMTVTWNNFGTSDFDPAVIDSFTAAPATWKSVNVTSLVQGWVDGTIPNYGVLLDELNPVSYNTYDSSEAVDTTMRPKLEVCYTAVGIPQTCVTIQRPGDTHEDVFDAYIWQNAPDQNNGVNPLLFTGILPGGNGLKMTLIRFDIQVVNPAVTIVKTTNGAIASDPNGLDVSQIKPGDPITWLYKVTNTGSVAVSRANVLVTDNQTGVTPVFDSEISGNGDLMFDPGEVLQYKATGTAANLLLPPPAVATTPNGCTLGGALPPHNSYVNIGTVTIPGATAQAPSSYCNTPDVQIVKRTNGQLATDPNGTDVPQIKPGDPVTWTYEVTNIGPVPIKKADVLVTDNQTGVTPVYDSEVSGNADAIFDPGEVWLYKATGTAANLLLPPPAVATTQGACTYNQTQPPQTAYVNQGTVTIPGVTKTTPSSYCNTGVFKWYGPFAYGPINPVPEFKWQLALGYEDLPLISGANDFDYNDWTVDVNGTNSYDTAAPTLITKMRMDFLPHARGAVYDHRFQILIPPGVFKSNGVVVLDLYDQNHNLISSTPSVFNGATGGVYVIFPKTSEALPGTFVNTVEGKPFVAPQRFADLTFTFDTPFPFQVDPNDFALAHGKGLFFDPYLDVLNTGDTVHIGDLRMLTVPSTDYIWPEERVRIDKAYPLVQYIPNPSPDFSFPNNWWKTFNHCLYDGVACVLP